MHKSDLELRSLIIDPSVYRLLTYIIKASSKHNRTMQFSQSNLITKKEFKQYYYLKQLDMRFNGLCEIISNAVIADDFMGDNIQYVKFMMQENTKEAVSNNTHSTVMQLISDVLSNLSPIEYHATSYYKDKITLNYLNGFAHSHILDVSSYWHQIRAFFSNIYMFDLFADDNNSSEHSNVDFSTLAQKLLQLPDGFYIKFVSFKKSFYSFNGHVMVIKKTGSSFSFFDPNFGEIFDLNITELWVQINHAMERNSCKYMLFMDGIEYLKYANIASNMQNHEELMLPEHSSASDFILSTIEKIILDETIDDEALVDALKNLFDGILQRSTQQLTLPNNATHFNRYLYDQTDFKIAELDQLRLSNSVSYWINFIKSKQYNAWVGTDSVRKLICFYIRTTQLSESLDVIYDFLVNIDHKSPQLVHNVYFLASLFFILNNDQCRQLCAKNHELLSMIKTPRHVQIIFNSAQTGCDFYCLTLEKRKIIFDAIKHNLYTMIQSTYDFKIITSALYKEAVQEIFEVRGSHMLDLVQSIGDLNDIMEYLDSSYKVTIFDSKRDCLDVLMRNSTVYDCRKMLRLLDVSERTSIINLMLKNLSYVHLGEVESFNEMYLCLNLEEANLFLDGMLDKLVNLVIDKTLLPVSNNQSLGLNTFIRIFQKIKTSVAPADALDYLLCRSNINFYHLSENDYFMLFEGLTEQLKEEISTCEDFILKTKNISGNYFTFECFTFDLLKDKFSSMVISTNDLGLILNKFNFIAHKKYFLDTPMQDCLENHFKYFASDGDIRELARGLIMFDGLIIKEQIDNLILELTQKNRAGLFNFFSRNTELDLLVDCFCDLTRNKYWRAAIDSALRLNYSGSFREEFDKYVATGINQELDETCNFLPKYWF